MLTRDLIEQVRHQTHVSTVDAMHALTLSGGDVARAVEELNDHAHAGNRKLVAVNRLQAQRLAAALVDSGIWFECEATANGQWHFAVAPGAYARVSAVFAALRDEPATEAA